jgi:type II secretion system protein N
MPADFTWFTRHPLLRKLAVPVGFLVAFFFFLIVTFPYDDLARRLEVEAGRAGAEMSIGSMGAAGLASVRARDVRVRLPSATGETLPELRFDKAVLSPDVLALFLRRTSCGFLVDAYGGRTKGHLSLSNDPRAPGIESLRLDATDVDLAALPLRDVAGLNAAGKLRLQADLVSLQPLETARGSLSLSLEAGSITEGTVMGLSLPHTSVGHLEGAVAVEKGAAKVERTVARGGDVEADLDGNISLRPLLSLSQADLHLRFRPSDRWLNENPNVRGVIGLLQNARQGDGSYLFSFGGPLSHLQPRPGR